MKKNKIFLSFLLSGLLGALIVVPNIIMNHGIYSLVADFNYQQIPFNKMINSSIKNGSFLWTWYNDFGSNFIGTFGFYNLFSPFNIIGYLFPAKCFEYLIGPIFIFKYAVCGATSYLFLKRYVENKNNAIIGSLLYTFSGFQITNILFYHFHDVVALFPLLLYSLDNLIYDNRRGGFALSVALLAFTNWFFFIGQCVFLIIYFLIKLILKDYNVRIKKFIQILFEGLIGLGIAMIVLLPCALFTVGNTRLNNSWSFLSMFKYPSFEQYLEIFRAFLFPSENMTLRAVMSQHNFASVELYLPVVGIVLALSYFFKYKKSFSSILMFILCLFMIIPILNSSFVLFQTSYYARWFYIPTLILSLMSVQCLDKKINIKTGVILSLIGMGIFVVCLFILKLLRKTSIIIDKKYLIMFLLFMIINLIVLVVIYRMKRRDLFLVYFIFIFVSIWGNYNVYCYKFRTFKTDKSYFQYLNSVNYLNLDKNSRTNSSSLCEYNYSYLLENNNIKSFNSNVNGASFEFYESVVGKRDIYTNVRVENKLLNDFLGVHYVIGCDNEALTSYGYELDDVNSTYNIYINNDYKEFGFFVNGYISKEEFYKLDYDERAKVLLQRVVLDDKQISEFKDLFNHNVEYLSNKFKFLENGFESNIISNNDTLAIYTIPYDKGFIATVNGKRTKIENVDNGFMGIKINKGHNKIRFEYMTPGLVLGLIISSISICLLLFYLLVGIIRKNYFKIIQ